MNEDPFSAAVPHLNAALAADASLVDVLRSVTPGQLESTAAVVAAAATEPSVLQAFSGRVPNASPGKVQVPHLHACVVRMQRRLLTSTTSGISGVQLQMRSLLDVGAIYGPSATPLFQPPRRAQRPAHEGRPDAERLYRLHQAVHAGDVGAAERLLEANDRSLDVNAPYGPSDDSALHLAARLNNERLIRMLIHKGADLNARSKNASTPLHYASWQGSAEAADALLEAGADLALRMEGGDTPLHQAVWRRKEAIVERLLRHAEAAYEGGAAAFVNLRKQDGTTALHFVGTGTPFDDLASALLRGGADPTISESAFGRTPLHLAALSGATSILGMMVNAGADPAARCATGLSALHYAALSGKEDAVEQLLTLGASVQREVVDLAGNTPLMLAAAKGHADIVARLLAAGACPNDRSLHAAAARGAVGALGLLLNSTEGPNPSLRLADSGAMPLHLAALNGHENCVLRLVTAGVGLDDVTTAGDAPLHLAVFHHRQSCVMRLVEAGANVNQPRRSDGVTPLHLAAMRGGADIARLLLESGASATAEDQGGVTPAECAAAAGHFDLARSIRSYRDQQNSRRSPIES
jgi:cytohesin